MRMTEIYGRADRVRVWLGTGDESTDVAMELLEDILDVETGEEAVSKGRKSIYNLLTRSWFSRRWVIQEIAFARKVTIFCGTKSLDWKSFADAVTTCEDIFLRSGDLLVGAINSEDLNRLGVFGLVYVSNNVFRRDLKGERVVHWLVSIEALVQRLNQFYATEPHDIVYAVLALAKDTYASRRIVVDYTKPVWEVYREVVSLIVEQSESLDIICRPWAAKQKDNPSWIRDCTTAAFGLDSYGILSRVNADTLVGELGKSPYRACGKLTAVTTKDDFTFYNREPSSMLMAEGFILDEIGHGGEVATHGIIPHSWLEFGAWNLFHSSPPPNAFWRTLVADRDGKGNNPPPWYPRICRQLFREAISPIGFNTEVMMLKHYQPMSMAREFIQRLQATTWNRRFAKTAINQAPGLFPSNAKKGDLICILHGCSVPVVMRPKDNTEPKRNGDQQSRRPLGVHIEPYLIQLRKIYAKQGGNWDNGFEHDEIYYRDERHEPDKILLDSFQSMPAIIPKTSTERSPQDGDSYGYEERSWGNSIAPATPSYLEMPKVEFECTLIGECYMYGVMDGEAMEMTRSGGIATINFGIS
ncbi:hypothetical protein B0O99DRAFT_633613 [Bisporella sp. PMI_857]|nr:hypothetical protein B0O99DRAFT_633613 [Bisporella sp. PMI_857]